MNRRNFLKLAFAGALGTALEIEAKIDNILEETANLSDVDFVTYCMFSMNLYVHNPAHSVMITNIEEPEWP